MPNISDAVIRAIGSNGFPGAAGTAGNPGTAGLPGKAGTGKEDWWGNWKCTCSTNGTPGGPAGGGGTGTVGGAGAQSSSINLTFSELNGNLLVMSQSGAGGKGGKGGPGGAGGIGGIAGQNPNSECFGTSQGAVPMAGNRRLGW